MEPPTIKQKNVITLINEEEPATLLDCDGVLQVVGGGGGDGCAAAGGGGGGGSLQYSPKLMVGFREAGPPPFLSKTFQMVEDPETEDVISWSLSRKSFIVWDHHKFSTNLLPKYFKHNNFSSFIRQLNTYGFKKIDSDRWEFSNEGFQGGKKHLLKNIKRKRRNLQTVKQRGGARRPLLDPASLGAETELGKLMRDRSRMKMEIQKLKQQQQITETSLAAITENIENTECNQQQIFVFMVKAFGNPAVLNRFNRLLRQKMAKEPKLTTLGSGDNSGDAVEISSTAEIGRRQIQEEEELAERIESEGKTAKKPRVSAIEMTSAAEIGRRQIEEEEEELAARIESEVKTAKKTSVAGAALESGKNSGEAMETASAVGIGRRQIQEEEEELATIESEVKTLISASLEDKGNADPEWGSPDLSSEIHILWEKLVEEEDEFMSRNEAEIEAELAQQQSKIVLELENLIAAPPS